MMKIYSALAVMFLLSACAHPSQTANSRDELLKIIAKKGQTRVYPAGITAEQHILQTDPVFADQKIKTLLTALTHSYMGAYVGGACPTVISPQELATLRNDNKGVLAFMQKSLPILHPGLTEADAANRVARVGLASLQEFQDRNYINCPAEVRTAFKYGQDGAKWILDFAYIMTGQRWSAN